MRARINYRDIVSTGVVAACLVCLGAVAFVLRRLLLMFDYYVLFRLPRLLPPLSIECTCLRKKNFWVAFWLGLSLLSFGIWRGLSSGRLGFVSDCAI